MHAADFTNDRGGADEPFRDALLRLKTRDGLYVQNERGVTFLTPAIFRAGMPLPATAPPGNYDVEVTLFADTVILARTVTSFELVKSGFEQQVGEMSPGSGPHLRQRNGAARGLLRLSRKHHFSAGLRGARGEWRMERDGNRLSPLAGRGFRS